VIGDIPIKQNYAMMAVFHALIFITAVAIAASQPALSKRGNVNNNEVNITQIKSHTPAATAHIQKYEIDEAATDSAYKTGKLRIIYDNTEEVIETPPPIHKSTDTNHVCNVIGFSDPKIAEDKRTIGWTEQQAGNGCFATAWTSGEIFVYRSGKTVLHISQGQAVWFWMFRDGGKHLAAVWGPTHGAEVGDYQLYDAATGKVTSETFGNPDTQSLAADAPEWAKQTEHAMHQQR